MIITRFSIQHFVAVLVLCLGVLVAGISEYNNLPRENFPDVKIPVVTVTTVMTGANPTDMEISITIPLETALEGIEGLKNLKSTSFEGMSQISLEFDPSIATEIALSRVRDAVDAGKADLPADVDEPIVKEFSLAGDIPVLILSLVGSEKITLSQLFELGEKIEDDLERIPGVLDIKVRGGRDRVILIEVDPDRMRYYNITIGQIQQILMSTNRNVSAGASEGTTNRIVMMIRNCFSQVKSFFPVFGILFKNMGEPLRKEWKN